MWKVKVTVIAVVIGALGKKLGKNLKDIWISTKVGELIRRLYC